MATNLFGAATSVGQLALTAALIKPSIPRSIGLFFPHVVINERHTDELEITEHPVETGTVIADHAYRKQPELVMEIGFSPSSPGAQSNLSTVYINALRSWIKPPVLLKVVTGKRIYTNMVVKSVVMTTDKDSENSIHMTVTLKDLFLVSTQDVSVPADPASQSNPAATQATSNQGAKQAIPATTPPRT